MKILSLGCSGFLGQALAWSAQPENIELVGLSSKTATGIDPVTGDLRASFSIPSGTEAVIYLAQSPQALMGPSGAIHTMKVNCQSATAAAIQAMDAGVRRFIYLSTGSVYAPSFDKMQESFPVRRDSWYSLTKLQAEESLSLLRQQIEITIVRPFGIYGPNQSGRLIPNLRSKILAGEPILLKPRKRGDNLIRDGGLKISLCHVGDAAKAILHFGMHGGPACVNLAAGESLSIRAIAQLLGHQLGIAPVFTEDENPRETDFVADTGLLSRCCPIMFRRFSESPPEEWQNILPGAAQAQFPC